MKTGKLKTLWKIDPHCYYCGIETELWNMPANAATIEHIHDNWTPKEIRYENKETKKVIACNSCNRSQNKKREKTIPKWMQQKRTELGQERKKLREHTPRPELFAPLNRYLKENEH